MSDNRVVIPKFFLLIDINILWFFCLGQSLIQKKDKRYDNLSFRTSIQ